MPVKVKNSKTSKTSNNEEQNSSDSFKTDSYSDKSKGSDINIESTV